MTNSSAIIINVHKYNGALHIHTANGDHFTIENIGGMQHTLPLKNVLFIPFSYKSSFGREIDRKYLHILIFFF